MNERDKELVEQEPVALVIGGVLVKSELPENYTGHLYTTPPKREWVGLSSAEGWEIIYAAPDASSLSFAAMRMVEAKLKEKNT